MLWTTMHSSVVVGTQFSLADLSAVAAFRMGRTYLNNVRNIPRISILGLLNRSSPASKSVISSSRFCTGICLQSVQHVRASSSSAQGMEVDIEVVGGRRKLMVQFRCNICGECSKKLVNGLAYEKGTVFVQCAGCGRHHKLVDNLGLVQEYDFRKKEDRVVVLS